MLLDLLDTSWPEYHAYKLLKEFCIIAFSSDLTISDANRLTELGHEFVEQCQLITVKLNPKAKVYCKLHHLLHYGDQVKFFSCLSHCSTARWEHLHQYSKKLNRTNKNYLNLAWTIVDNHQLMRSMRGFDYSNEINKFQKISHEDSIILTEPFSSSPLSSELYPFPLNDNIVREIVSNHQGPKRFFMALQFVKDENESIFAKGLILEQILANGSPYFVNDLPVMHHTREDVFINIEFLHYANNYIYFHNNSLTLFVQAHKLM